MNTVFPANNTAYRSRKRAHKACDQCKSGRKKCLPSFSNHDRCQPCVVEGIHCSLIQVKLKQFGYSSSTLVASGEDAYPGEESSQVKRRKSNAVSSSSTSRRSSINETPAIEIEREFDDKNLKRENGMTYSNTIPVTSNAKTGNIVDLELSAEANKDVNTNARGEEKDDEGKTQSQTREEIDHEEEVEEDEDSEISPFIGEMRPEPHLFSTNNSNNIGSWAKTAPRTRMKQPKSNSDYLKIRPSLLDHLKAIKAFDIPSPDAIQGLVNIYRQHIHPTYPIVHLSSIENWEAIQESPPLLIHAITLVAALCPGAEIYLNHLKPRKFCAQVFEKIQALMYAGIDENNKLLRCRVLALISIYVPDGPTGLEKASSLAEQASHQAITIGLHHQRTYHNTDDYYSSLLSIASMRQLWWSIYSLDRMYACVAARTLVLNLADCSVIMPDVDLSDPPGLVEMVKQCQTLESVVWLYRPRPPLHGLNCFEELFHEIDIISTIPHISSSLSTPEKRSNPYRDLDPFSPTSNTSNMTNSPSTHNTVYYPTPINHLISLAIRLLFYERILRTHNPTPLTAWLSDIPSLDHYVKRAPGVLIETTNEVMRLAQQGPNWWPGVPLLPYVVSLGLVVLIRHKSKMNQNVPPSTVDVQATNPASSEYKRKNSDGAVTIGWRKACRILIAMGDRWQWAGELGAASVKIFERINDEKKVVENGKKRNSYLQPNLGYFRQTEANERDTATKPKTTVSDINNNGNNDNNNNNGLGDFQFSQPLTSATSFVRTNDNSMAQVLMNDTDPLAALPPLPSIDQGDNRFPVTQSKKASTKTKDQAGSPVIIPSESNNFFSFLDDLCRFEISAPRSATNYGVPIYTNRVTVPPDASPHANYAEQSDKTLNKLSRTDSVKNLLNHSSETLNSSNEPLILSYPHDDNTGVKALMSTRPPGNDFNNPDNNSTLFGHDHVNDMVDILGLPDISGFLEGLTWLGGDDATADY